MRTTDPSQFKGDDLPVANVTWDRLPSEAEWEYAAWAGSASPEYGTLDGIAWYEGERVGAS